MSNHDYITKDGMLKIQRRIQYLQETERPEVIHRVSVARELGDLSENAEYKAAKEKQREIDQELDHLKVRSAKLRVIDPITLPKDKVTFGAIVKVKELDSGRDVTYRIVGVDEVNFTEEGLDLVSIASPIGKALLSRKPGEEVTIQAPMGKRIFKIYSIE